MYIQFLVSGEWRIAGVLNASVKGVKGKVCYVSNDVGKFLTELSVAREVQNGKYVDADSTPRRKSKKNRKDS